MDNLGVDMLGTFSLDGVSQEFCVGRTVQGTVSLQHHDWDACCMVDIAYTEFVYAVVYRYGRSCIGRNTRNMRIEEVQLSLIHI